MLPGVVQTGPTFADAAAEWLRYIEHDRRRKPSTVAGYKVIVRSQLVLAFGDLPIEAITMSMIEKWVGSIDRSPSTWIKAIVLMHGIFQGARKVWGLPLDPERGGTRTHRGLRRQPNPTTMKASTSYG
jgi:integrase